MAARFRCPECNRPLRDHDNDHSGGSVLKCPYCGARMVVPTYLAGAPQPQTDPPTPITPDDAPEMPLHDPVVLPVMARSMPWLVSMCFHVALAMIFMFVAMIIVLDDPPDVGVPAGCSFMPKDMTPINDITHRTKPRLSDLRKRLDKRT
ncbi:MAG: hypothetical protein GY794_06875, partial [bacterium]|nr:hypothetical protein [bacterium]